MAKRYYTYTVPPFHNAGNRDPYGDKTHRERCGICAKPVVNPQFFGRVNMSGVTWATSEYEDGYEGSDWGIGPDCHRKFVDKEVK